METLGWLTRLLSELPPGDGWLGDREQRVLAGMRFERRRADWRLGRFAAKAAVGSWLSVDPARVQILPAADGAPEAWLDDRPAPVSLSISHRAGRALVAIADRQITPGCDLEVIEPRSDAFVSEWFAESEQQRVRAHGPAEQALVANLIWSAKEAAAKVRRQGLRLDLRHASVDTRPLTGSAHWQPLTVAWNDGAGTVGGWWQAEPGWVMVLTAEPGPVSPRAVR